MNRRDRQHRESTQHLRARDERSERSPLAVLQRQMGNARLVQMRASLQRSDAAAPTLPAWLRNEAAAPDAVQLDEDAELTPGMRALGEALSHEGTTARRVVDVIRLHLRERSQLLAEVRRRRGDAFADEVQGILALMPESVERPAAGGVDLTAPAPPPAGGAGSPLGAARDGSSVDMSVRGGDHADATVRARPSTGEREGRFERAGVTGRTGRDSEGPEGTVTLHITEEDGRATVSGAGGSLEIPLDASARLRLEAEYDSGDASARATIRIGRNALGSLARQLGIERLELFAQAGTERGGNARGGARVSF